MTGESACPPVLFGGPDRPERFLRDTLAMLVDQAPAGSSIAWATYYFRDLDLAEALIRASDRGVDVRLVLEGDTRRPHVNDAVIARLGAHGLNGGLTVRRRGHGLGHLHAKIYAFSSPGVALVGSFNPSGNDPEDPEVIAEIGDQDRGYNLLYPIRDRAAVKALGRHVRRLASTRPSLLDRFRRGFRTPVLSGNVGLWFFPRTDTLLVEHDLAGVGRGDEVLAAVSHLKSGTFLSALEGAATRGADVHLLLSATERRVPQRVVDRLAAHGVDARRIGDGGGVPMHNKFTVVRGGEGPHAWLGSYNHNLKSRLLNDEILVRTGEAAAVEALAGRFHAMQAAA
ncbi:hypothetical protein KY084_03990 [Stakelama sp. CBK3Z-3]|uniref:phospholipase D n=1 Tax=Stakelama flava TaxID=2860338 RepID=A0ABS6XIK6_9SPHN|nr:phospholipase D-like domain-containing protein [Stakelama flava]MBW4330033.1 hypothetical protein [Stakelama flava]